MSSCLLLSPKKMDWNQYHRPIVLLDPVFYSQPGLQGTADLASRESDASFKVQMRLFSSEEETLLFRARRVI
jgi:hypothetical protein